MKKSYILIITALLLALVFFLTSLSGWETWYNFKKAFINPPASQEKIIKIGVLEPLTGRQSYDAEDEIAGMELAYSLFPTVGGYKIELIKEDNRSSATICPDAAGNLINYGCAVVLGSVSDTLSLAASDTFKASKVPAIAATCSVPILTQSNNYYFRVSTINSYDAAGAADFIYNELKAECCAILLPENNDYASNKAELFEKNFVKLTGATSSPYTYEKQDPDTKQKKSYTIDRDSVYIVNIKGTETEAEMNAVFEQLSALGYYSIYSPTESKTALSWIYQGSKFFESKTNKDDKKQDENIPELTTREYYNDQGQFVTETGYYDKNNNWIVYVKPEDKTETTEEGSTTDTEENTSDENESEEPEDKDNKDKDKETQKEQYFSWVGTDVWADIDELAKANYEKTDCLKHVFYTFDYDSMSTQTETSELFLAEYRKAYGLDKTPSNAVALGFDAYLLAYTAIKDSIEYVTGNIKEVTITDSDESTAELSDTFSSFLFNKDGVFNRELLTRMLYRIRSMNGATGSISIDANGDPTKDILIEAYNGFEFRSIYTAVPNLMEEIDETQSDEPTSEEEEQ